MKNRILKLTSFLLVLFIAASVFTSCKGNGDDETTTEEQASEVIATTAGETTELTTSTVAQKEIDKIVKAALDKNAEWDGDYSSLTQDQRVDVISEMYEKGYIARFSNDELYVVTIAEYEAAQKSSTSSGDIDAPEGTATTGSGTTSGQKVSTTAKGDTTTARKGIVPGTTAKNGVITTTKKPSSVTTTKAGSGASTTASGSASTTSSGGSGDVGEGQVTKPEVTYLDKYVINVMNSAKYTIKLLFKVEDGTIAVTRYVEEKNNSTVGVIAYSGIKLTSKIIFKNDKYYIVVPILSQYAEVTREDIGDFADDEFTDMLNLSSIFETMDSWEYRGVTRATGVNIETYKDTDGTVWKFSFSSNGLQKIESVKNGTTETFNIVIESGVSSSEAFTIPSGYKKTTIEEMKNSIPGIIPGA